MQSFLKLCFISVFYSEVKKKPLTRKEKLERIRHQMQMASNDLSKAEQNFTCFAKACIDFIKLPLIDILTDHVKPVDLYSKIKCSSILMSGKNKLRTEQLNLCFFPQPLLPDYSKFDVTLLYTLIRNLCSSLTPTRGWGLEPNDTDKKIGDDIERLRLFRNNYAHADSTEILDAVFNNLWKDLQSIIRRIQIYTKTWSTTNYEQELSRIKKWRFGYDDRDKYKLLLEATLYVSKSEKLGKLLLDKTLNIIHMTHNSKKCNTNISNFVFNHQSIAPFPISSPVPVFEWKVPFTKNR